MYVFILQTESQFLPYETELIYVLVQFGIGFVFTANVAWNLCNSSKLYVNMPSAETKVLAGMCYYEQTDSW